MAFFMKGQIIAMEGGGGSIRFEWNPESIQGPDASAGWDAIKTAGRTAPYLQYSCGDPRVIKFTLKLSRYDGSDSQVKDTIEKLVKLTKASVGQSVKHPPKVKLLIGSYINKTCVVKDVQPLTHKLFAPFSLNPRFGEVTVTFWEMEEEGGGGG
jgi:hypothetical protein